MLRKLFGRMFGGEKIFMPSIGGPSPKKLSSVLIFRAREPEDINKLKKRLGNSRVAFIDVSSLLMGTERKSFVNRLQSLCKARKMRLYGIDRKWLVITAAELEVQ